MVLVTAPTLRAVQSAHHELSADELASDEDGLSLLRAAARAAAEPASSSSSTTAEELGASWSDCYFDRPIDDGAYGAMISDTTRTPAFAAALHRRLSNTSDQVVLDIGTGPACLLALLAARAGARRVYAVEANAHAAERARASVLAAGYDESVIVVLSGYSTAITLPEKADLLVAELVGSIASSEGLLHTMADAQRRHLKRPHDPSSYIPQRVQTLCAPASYVLSSLLRPPYSSTYDFAKRRIEAEGNPLVYVGAGDAAVQRLCAPQILEDFDFSFAGLGDGAFSSSRRIAFTIDASYLDDAAATHADGLGAPLLSTPELGCTDAESVRRLSQKLAASLAGIACWPRLVLDESLAIEGDACDCETGEESHWQTALVLLSLRPHEVAAGDDFNVEFEARFGDRVDAVVSYQVRAALRRGRR